MDETRNYLLDEIKHNHVMSEKHKKTFKYLNCVKHLFMLASTITCCFLISSFTSLVAISLGIASSGMGFKNCTITAGIKKYKLIIRKKEENAW